jgi:hypothetical protein
MAGTKGPKAKEGGNKMSEKCLLCGKDDILKERADEIIMEKRIIESFERKSGIKGLEFKCRGNEGDRFSLIARVPKDQLGVMANNFREVWVTIDCSYIEASECFLDAFEGEQAVYYKAYIAYTFSLDGCGDHIEVMSADGKEVHGVIREG